MIDQTDLQLRFTAHGETAARVNREGWRRPVLMPRGAAGRWAIAATATSTRRRVEAMLSWIGVGVVRDGRRHQLTTPSLVGCAEHQSEHARA